MAEEQGMYGGYESDEVKVSPFTFGLNAGVCFLKKFEWIPNGGKDGAEQEALDIVFLINGVEKNYRKFPVTQGFDKNNNPVTDPKAPEFIDAVSDLKRIITHILHVFVEDDVIKTAMARPITSFKQYCTIARDLLPGAQTPNIPLDIFMQYQYKLREGQTRTYLEIPNKMKYGRFISKAIAPVGSWKAVVVDNPDDNVREALKYVDDAGNVHPFVKNGWFMKSNFATQQRAEGTSEGGTETTTSTDGQAGSTSTGNINTGNTTAQTSAW